MRDYPCNFNAKIMKCVFGKMYYFLRGPIGLVFLDIGFGNRGFVPPSFSHNVFTLPSRFASGRVVAALRGRRGRLVVAVPPGEPSPAKRRPSRWQDSREGDVLGAAADRNPRNHSGRQP